MALHGHCMKRAVSIAVAGCLLLSLTGCNLPPRTSKMPNHSTELPGGAEITNFPEADVTNSPNAPDSTEHANWDDLGSVGVNDFPLTFLRTAGLKPRQLSCTIQGVELLDNVSRLPKKNFETWPAVDAMDGDGQMVVLRYPDFVGEGGQLLPGLYLLLANVNVTSEGAQSYTRQDRDASGAPRGEFIDPHVFRADLLFWLKEFVGNAQGECDLGYFSGKDDEKEHRLAYRLEEGATKSFTLGFWIYDVQQGGNVSLDQLYLVALDRILTKIDLDAMGGVVG